LIATYRRFRFTTLVYTLIAFHMIILLVGGHYTYAQVPLFNWRATDCIWPATISIGSAIFAPGLCARDDRRARCFDPKFVVKRGFWLNRDHHQLLPRISALYELFEWQAAIIAAARPKRSSAPRADPWDTQKDMATCLLGAVCALILLSGWHDPAISADDSTRSKIGNRPVTVARWTERPPPPSLGVQPTTRRQPHL